MSSRIDEKDRVKGFPINWNHWDFYSTNHGFLTIPSNDKRDKHWFKSAKEWKESIQNEPPHQERIPIQIEEIDK